MAQPQKLQQAGLAVLAFAFLTVLYSQWAALHNPYVFNNDIRAHLFWMQQWLDPGLFQDDLLADFSRSIQPWGFVWLYRGLALFAEPFFIAKLIPLVLFPCTAWGFFRLLEAHAGLFAGLLGAAIFCVVPTFLLPEIGGLARAFLLPLVVAFLYQLSRDRHARAAGLIVLAAFFYPVAALLCSATYALSFIELPRFRLAFPVRKTACFATALAVLAAVVALRYGGEIDPRVGSTVTRAEMKGRAVFYPKRGGRVPALPVEPVHRAVGAALAEPFLGPRMLERYLAPHLPPAPSARARAERQRRVVLAVVGAALLLGLAHALRRRRLPAAPVLLQLAGASVLLYLAADLFLFKLYLPQRYVQATLPLVAVFAVAAGLAAALARIRTSGRRRAVQVLLLVLVATQLPMNRGLGLQNEVKQAPLFRFVETLPKQSLLAAHPLLADSIPTLAKRKVLISFELSIPWFDRYWKTIRERTADFFAAYYAEDPAAVRAFCEKYGVDYLVVDRAHFSPLYLRQRRIYFEPFNELVLRQIGSRRNFALARVPQSAVLFERNGVYVLDVAALR